MSKTPQQQRGMARTRGVERHQVEMQFLSLDQWLDKEHRVRDLWRYAESLDLSELYESINATVGNVGRDAIDPRVLFGLWLFATTEGISSARRISELTGRDIAYMWLCGGRSINYHKLSDFRSEHGELLERILTESVGVLLHHGLVELKTIGQDGMRVRASAGSGSFRRQATLEESLKLAEEHVAEVQRQSDEDHDGGDKRRQAARQRAAQEKQDRLEAALEEMKDMQARYKKRTSSKKSSEPRASTTDPQARRMKMGDGGTRPAMNVQFASDGDAQLIVAVEVTSQGSDSGLMRPVYDTVCQRYGRVPENYLVDGGFGKKEDVTHLGANGTKVFAPLYAEQKQLDQGQDPYSARAKESAEMAAYRQRMGTAEGKAMYRRRAAIAEFPNADCRNRGLSQFRVRGLKKAKAQTLWHALIYNYQRMKRLFCEHRNQSYLEIVMTS